MTKYLSIILIVTLFFSCKKKNESVLVFNSEPAEKFIELIDYIEKNSNQKLISEKFPDQRVLSNYEKNKTDKLLNIKINNLLDLPTYQKLSEITKVNSESFEIKGKNAYKFAFLNLPFNRVQMSGDINSQWIDYWQKKNNLKSINFIEELKINSENIKNKLSKLCNNYYPTNLIKKDTIETVFCLDGNRGNFTSDNIIYMDLITFTDFNIDRFTKVLAHELHHVNYSNWLLDYIKLNSDKQKAIFKLQRGIILEGIAVQITYEDYNYQVKGLYNNKELINELNKSFMEDLFRISESETPFETFEELNSKMWINSNLLLEKYCKDDLENETSSHRPTYLYYISYLLYDTIEKNGRNEEIKFVIEHPETLLEVYNNLWSENDLIPKYPIDIIEIWKNNFKG